LISTRNLRRYYQQTTINYYQPLQEFQQAVEMGAEESKPEDLEDDAAEDEERTYDLVLLLYVKNNFR